MSSLSWFMRCLAEPIARSANSEDKCTGRFWEGRYKCQPILDESALAACLAYVDLNPIRARVAKTPETSRFTSVYERLQAIETRTHHDDGGPICETPQSEPAEEAPTRNPDESSDALGETQPAAGDPPALCRPPSRPSDAWLSPFELSEETMRKPVPTGRASNTGCLPMSFADYACLVDWTGRQLRRDKRGAIPEDLAPILERLGVNSDGWLQLVREFSRLFRRAAGTPASLRRDADKWGRRRMPGIMHSRAVFA
jgi:hypothetical protein